MIVHVSTRRFSSIKRGVSIAVLMSNGNSRVGQVISTNLHRLGVPVKAIQAILRHANISSTLNNYIKSVPADAVAAGRSLEAVCTQYAPNFETDEEDES